MRVILLLLIFISPVFAKAQDSFYHYLNMGDYQVAYCDSIIFDAEKPYNQFAYKGASPLFLQIWYPFNEADSSRILQYGELIKKDIPNDLSSIYTYLRLQMDSSFIDYNLLDEFVNFEPINYGEHTVFDVLESIKSLKTRSVYRTIKKKLEFPVIIYHHGAQGRSDENHILAEYFASRGFVVIASNYHWPYEHEVYGTGDSDTYNVTSPKIVSEFAKAISSHEQLFFIGHSMGAQVGFSYLYEKGWANAFVSMETTLENKDVEKIKGTWSELYKTLQEHQYDYQLPILMFANYAKGIKTDFGVFNSLDNAKITRVSCKHEFGHESYTSAYLLRYLFREKYKQPDTIEMKSQLELYVSHLQIIELFLKSQTQGIPLDLELFEDSFFIE